MMLSAIVVVSRGDESRLGKLLKGGCPARWDSASEKKEKGPEARSPTATWPTTTTNGYNLSTTTFFPHTASQQKPLIDCTRLIEEYQSANFDTLARLSFTQVPQIKRTVRYRQLRLLTRIISHEYRQLRLRLIRNPIPSVSGAIQRLIDLVDDVREHFVRHHQVGGCVDRACIAVRQGVISKGPFQRLPCTAVHTMVSSAKSTLPPVCSSLT